MIASYAEAKIEIERLVERFDRNLDAYKRADYKEAHVRAEFIDPLFEALGWDVRNVQGYAEQYKDVVHEDAIKVGGATRAPDYCFRIGGVRKFFLEAKKPSVWVKGDVGPAYQLRRYAWSAKLPLSILTDFEEFAVYDCRQRPKPDDRSSTGRVIYLTFDQYPDRFDDIYGVFAKESVLQGSFDRYVQDTRRKRGTSEVDAEFLREIEGWRDALAHNIALRNAALSVHELNYAVQRTIDRIIFLRMCEDRSIEEYGRLLALTSGPHIYARLGDLYRQADERYDSDLFDFQADTLSKSLTVDDKVIKPILVGLYYPQSPYEFSVLPAEILGQVYEQFLGKVIRLTPAHRAKVEEKPEVKKAGGVYYTPAYIVDYIVEQTVGKLVEGKTPRQISKVHILDPACGSGSFLLGAYQYLLDYHRQWYEAHDPAKHARSKRPKLYQGPQGEWRLTTAERKRILLNNIYGVDIDRQAVEVTKLSLLLKVLEGESQETLGQQLTLWRERALPNLGDNIKCGNSLIGPDYFEAQLMPDEEEMRRVNPFDWEAEFPEIMATGGFSAVVGNPPYLAGREWHDALRQQRSYFGEHYSCMTDQYDLYALFMQRAVELVGFGGYFGFITPSTWLNNEHYTRLREWLVQRARIERLGDYRDINVFHGATVLPIVIVSSRSKKPDYKHRFIVERFRGETDSDSLTTSVSVWAEFPNLIFSLSVSEDDLPILRAIEKVSQPVSAWSEVRFGVKVYQRGKGTPPQTGEEAKQKLFESSIRESDDYYPYIRGKYVNPWHIDTGRAWLKYGPHLAEPRSLTLFTGPRVLVRRIVGDRLIIAPTKETLIADQLLHTVKPREDDPDCRYLAALLRSRLVAYYFKKRFDRTEKTFPEIRVAELRQLPIRAIDFSDQTDIALHDKAVALADRMSALHRKLATATIPADKTLYERQIEATDRQIEALVYELYGLTDEEIAVVEGKSHD
jgi:predicted type IV restriction endonuclease